MDMHYLNILIDFYQQIKKQQALIQQIKARFQSTSTIPLNQIHPTIKSISELRAFLQCIIHMHEKDTMRKVHKYFLSCLPHIAEYLNRTWFCHCHNPSSDYDWILLLTCNFLLPLLTTHKPFFFCSHTFFISHLYPSLISTTLSLT